MSNLVPPLLTSAVPQLFVQDLPAACAFYQDRLGFEVVFVYGTPPFYSQVRRHDAQLNLRQTDQPVIDPALRDRETLLAASIGLRTAADLNVLAAEYRAKAVRFHTGLHRTLWGAMNLIVHDLDGNLLLFSSPVEPS